MPSHLFSPFTLRGATLANRVVVAPMCQYSATDVLAASLLVSPSAICRFLAARGLTRKKDPRTPPSRSARTSPPPAATGARSSRR